jgi:hypothetical protein
MLETALQLPHADFPLEGIAMRVLSASKLGLGALALGVLLGLTPIAGQAQTCPSGQTICNGACVNLASDLNNCGGCGFACAAGNVCTAGVCAAGAPTCSSGQISCNGACVNPVSDPNNCGACGVACTAGKVCAAGACVAAATNSIFACQFISGKLSGTTAAPALSGPVNAPCSDNYGSSGVQVNAVFACQFTQGPMAGTTVVPTGITLFGPVGQPCTDNYGNSGAQVISQQ